MRSRVVNLVLALTSLVVAVAVAAPIPLVATEYPYGGSDVSIITTAHVETKLTNDSEWYLFDSTITVTLAVRRFNATVKKDAGIRFTADGGLTFDEVAATFKEPLDRNYETWVATITRRNVFSGDEQAEYEVSGFVSYNNQPRIFDPLGNYYIYKKNDNLSHVSRQKPTPTQPVVLVSDSLGFDPVANQVMIKGYARTYSKNRAQDYIVGRMMVRWTFDDGETFFDSPATPQAGNNSWTWSIPVASTLSALPERVNFELLYKPFGSLTSFNLSPPLTPTRMILPRYELTVNGVTLTNGISDLGTGRATGIMNFTITTTTDLPLDPPQAKFDDAPFTTFGIPENAAFTLDTSTLTNGVHTFTVRVPAAGGKEGGAALEISSQVTVGNRVKLIERWLPKRPAGVGVEVDPSGGFAADGEKVYFAWGSRGVARYARFGESGDPEVFYKTLDDTFSFDTITALSLFDNKLYALATETAKIMRWNADGNLDATFGKNGVLSLYGSKLADNFLCSAFDMTVVGGFVFVSDSCNNRVLKFTLEGSVIAELNLFAPVTYLTNDGTDLYVGTAAGFEDTRIRVIKPTTFTNPSTSTLLRGSRSLARLCVGKEYLVASEGSAVRYFNRSSGASTTRWIGGGGWEKPLPGTVGNVKSVVALVDGNFAVADQFGVMKFGGTVLPA
ncbi:hypothetical protein HDU67_005444 [Dinochytrium kinnereticum]|nr:hypothetical protein HDU67_005444 [Dinochytrium kinnereticum]